MGVPKQLLQFGGETMLRRAASVALKAGCRPVVVVTGANVTPSRKALRGRAGSDDFFLDVIAHREAQS
jgi:CTP:molybdopterin cytidylyltransferase MocA